MASEEARRDVVEELGPSVSVPPGDAIGAGAVVRNGDSPCEPATPPARGARLHGPSLRLVGVV